MPCTRTRSASETVALKSRTAANMPSLSVGCQSGSSGLPMVKSSRTQFA